MMSSNGNIFRVTGPLSGEFTGYRCIPLTKASDGKLRFFFFDLRPNKRLSKQWRRWWVETPSRSFWRHCDEISSLRVWFWSDDDSVNIVSLTISTIPTICEGNPSVPSVWALGKVNNADVLYFLSCYHKQAGDQTIELLVKSDALCDVTIMLHW